MRHKLNALLSPAPAGSRGASHAVDVAIVVVILLDLLLFVIGAESGLPPAVHRVVIGLEDLIVVLFAIEYLARLWSCVEDERYRAPAGSRLRYSMTPMAVVDLLAALPVLTLIPGLGLVFPLGMSTLRGFRVLRLVRVGKLVRYSPSMRAFGRAIHRVREELMVVLVFVTVLALTGASLIVYFERDMQPGVLGDFADGIWWAIVTMTTVGYGDVVPITPSGRLVAAVLAIAGIGVFAAPAGLLAAAFGEEMQRDRSRRERRRERERRDREERRLGLLVEEAVEQAIDETLGGALDPSHTGRVIAAARAAAKSASASVNFCPHCGESIGDHR
ncbi:ion transporter [Engelhardtia mirabilis]|uniref:Cyclic nucleotide-gated potassium channel n=1 Tax=Engelhardtia mirabilis TaxID=2528011 RepID=A0A518BHQ1_9BACT|nr:Cyclic nucleotide-gated potassium channel [Planctomycetes bacterium Pla133]QDV00834.1 Cyclic nucleotide-gated potassium channel [Planctomycetes bacterium Pla86]